MLVMLSVVSCFDWFVKLVVGKDVLVVFLLLENEDGLLENVFFFFLYLSGECMLYNDFNVFGVFVGFIY